MKVTKFLLKNKNKKGDKRPKTDIKIFLKKKNQKASVYHRDRNKNLSEEKKTKES